MIRGFRSVQCFDHFARGTEVQKRGVLPHSRPEVPDFVADSFLTHVELFMAISTINFRTLAGTRGRPPGRDFHFQNNPNPRRCQRISVSGWTIVRAFRQSKKREIWASVKRMESVAR